MNRRDDFTESTKATLAKRVAYFCSNPDCRDRTSGPHSEDAKSVVLGEAAHITAASAGGARFDASLTSERRKSPSNGIWLCRKCARLIDADGVRFPVELLHAWKTIAENHARENLEPHSTPSNGPDINFEVREWKAWRTRGISSHSNHLVVVTPYGRGDIQYQGHLYLRNNTESQQLMTGTVLQFHVQNSVEFSDDFALQRQDIALPVNEWTAIGFHSGLHMPDGPDVYSAADSVWLCCEIAGSGPRSWRIAEINGDAASLSEI